MIRIPYRISNAVRRSHQGLIFRTTLPRALATCRRGGTLTPGQLGQLVYGWGNASYSADTNFLEECLSRVGQGTGPILECGSGLSTLLLAAAAESRGRTLVALEHTPAWADRVQAELDRYGLRSARVLKAPLVCSDGFDWYDVAPVDPQARFALVVCDGPPMATRGGRYGLLPIMRSRLTDDAVVLLDDAVRPEERAIAARWQTEFGGRLEHRPEHKGIIVYQLGAEPVGS